MRTRTSAWLVWGLTAVLVALRLVLQYDNDPSSFLGNLFKVLSLAFATVGALVASRRPRNPVGWIFGVGALLLALSDFAEQYTVYALISHPGMLPGGMVMGWIRLWASSLGFYLIFTFTLLLFPNGHVLSPRWRPVVWLAAGVGGVTTVMAALQPGPFFFLPSFNNPFGVEGISDALPWVNVIVNILALVVVGACAASMILRFSRAQGEERQQFKWVTYAAVLFIFYVIVSTLTDVFSPQYLPVVDLAEAPVLVALPVAIGIAVLKYRLYNIDLIVRRTLIYGALTAALALIYFGSVALLQTIVQSITGQKQSQFAIALSTLAIAALFAPLRSQTQNAIDRRFYRRKYNAEKTIAAFSSILRNEMDLHRLESALQSVLEETFQPESSWVWMREASLPGRESQIEH